MPATFFYYALCVAPILGLIDYQNLSYTYVADHFQYLPSIGIFVLIVNTINAAGDEGPKARPHILFWGVALGAVVAALLLVGGLKAIQTAMVIGALPFSVVMVLQCIAIIKAIYNDGRREKAGIPTTVSADAAQSAASRCGHMRYIVRSFGFAN